MDEVKAIETAPPVSEDDAMTPRGTLGDIVKQCEHALENRIAKRFSTRESLQNLKRRAEALLERGGGWQWDQDFQKVVTTATAVFDELIAQAGTSATVH